MNKLLVDIGGTKTNIFLASQDSFGKINIISSTAFQTEKNPENEVQKICDFLNTVSTLISSINLSLPGKWTSSGILSESVNLTEWLGFPFISELKNKSGVEKIHFETDVICGGIGEYFHGVCKELELPNKSLLYINLGTGIGASFIQNGIPFKSKNSGFNTLRLHKMVFPFNDEIYAGVDFLSGASLRNISGLDSVKALFENYRKLDIEAMDIISKSQAQLGAWLINLFYLFSPDIIVLNGGLTYEWDVICEEAVEIAQEEINNQIKILPSSLRDMSNIYGTALLN